MNNAMSAEDEPQHVSQNTTFVEFTDCQHGLYYLSLPNLPKPRISVLLRLCNSAALSSHRLSLVVMAVNNEGSKTRREVNSAF